MKKSQNDPGVVSRLHQRYIEKVRSVLASEFGYANPLGVPRLTKVVVATSFKEDQHQDDAIKAASAWVAAITGQKPKTTRARKAIAGFDIRAGDVIGLAATLRGRRMWEFIDKFIATALPRMRDFQGVPASGFDGHGNYTIGLTEQIIFPEVEYDSVGKVRGLQISFVTTAGSDTIARRLFEELGMPFEKESHG